MKFLYIAFECDPYRGSEAYCGWSWVRVMAQQHEIHVITRPENKKNIERYIEENHITNLHVNYCYVPAVKYLTLGKGYHFMLYFKLWTNAVYPIAKQLHQKEHFDYIHQVTLGDFRFIGKCWKLDSKFVFGPVGGGQVTPKVFKKYTRGHWKNEKIRECINKLTVLNPSYRKAINSAYRIYSANEETKAVIDKVLYDKSKNILLTENGVSEELLKKLESKKLREKDKVIILWSGRIVYRKGLLFLLEVLTKVHAEKPYELWLFGTGSEIAVLQKFVIDNKQENVVKFKGKVTYEEMQRSYQSADIFVFPSLRETTGTVLFEAMVNKLAIIMFNQNGGKLLLQDNCGVLVDIDKSLEEIQADFADKLTRLIDDFDWRVELTDNAMKKLKEQFVWESKVKNIDWSC